MPKQERFKTNYAGVYFIFGESVDGKPEKIFYIRYRKEGKSVEEKAGRQFRDDMTAAKASNIRAERIKGHQLSNKELRKKKAAEKKEKENRYTLNLLWEKYIEDNPNLKGIVSDKSRYKKHLMPVFGEKEPQEITPFHVDSLRIKLLKTHKPQTVKHILVLLRRIINYGVFKRFCIGLNFKIVMPKVDNEKTEDLSPEQLRLLLKAIEEDHDFQAGNIMKMALFSGMRRSEIFRLQWKDVDFRNGFIIIRDSKGGKTQKIPLNSAARELLENHPRSKSPFIFPGKDGKQRVECRKPINRIKQRASLPKDFRPLHGLRHVYASMLASSGKVDMYTLQKLLTHKSPLMTQRYAHLRDETLKRASNLIGDLVKEAVNGNQDKKVVNLDDN